MFDGISPSVLYKLSKKQEETTRSLEKIEKGKYTIFDLADVAVCYALRLRLVEFGDKPEVLRAMAKRALDESNMGSSGGAGGERE